LQIYDKIKPEAGIVDLTEEEALEEEQTKQAKGGRAAAKKK
jgi:hypothetical protein